jgi:N-acetylglucosamine kinase-like BadF-type ATPase
VVGELVGGAVDVCGDEEIALDAAFRGGPGILVIGGTGSNVVGRCGDGTKLTAGGWGPAIGDEGSGFWIGKEAVRQAFWALDREVKTDLLEWMRVAWGVGDVEAIVAFANTRPEPDFAALAPMVVALAEAGDSVAERVLLRAGVELAEQVEVVWKKMRRHGEWRGAVAYTGGVVEKVALVREGMRRRIEARCVGLRVMGGVVALEGALWRARGTVMHAGIGTRDEWG